MLPLGTQNPPKMHWNSMFFLPETSNCTKKLILGMIVFLSIFWIAIFPFFGKIRCPNEVPGKNNFHTFASILEVKRHFLTLPLFLSIFLAKMLKKCWNSMPINWKAHRMESKFDSQSYARLTDLPKGLTQHYLTKPPHERVHWTLPKASYPPLPYQPSKSKGGGQWLGSAATIIP